MRNESAANVVMSGHVKTFSNRANWPCRNAAPLLMVCPRPSNMRDWFSSKEVGGVAVCGFVSCAKLYTCGPRSF